MGLQVGSSPRTSSNQRTETKKVEDTQESKEAKKVEDTQESTETKETQGVEKTKESPGSPDTLEAVEESKDSTTVKLPPNDARMKQEMGAYAQHLRAKADAALNGTSTSAEPQARALPNAKSRRKVMFVDRGAIQLPDKSVPTDKTMADAKMDGASMQGSASPMTCSWAPADGGKAGGDQGVGSASMTNNEASTRSSPPELSSAPPSGAVAPQANVPETPQYFFEDVGYADISKNDDGDTLISVSHTDGTTEEVIHSQDLGRFDLFVDGGYIEIRDGVQINSITGTDEREHIRIHDGEVAKLDLDGGNDNVMVGEKASVDEIHLGDGDDELVNHGWTGAAYGDAGNDRMTAMADAGHFYGGEDNDVLRALGGGGVVAGLHGEGGNDTIKVDGPNDIVNLATGGEGDDTIVVQDGQVNFAYGMAGDDKIVNYDLLGHGSGGEDADELYNFGHAGAFYGDGGDDKLINGGPNAVDSETDYVIQQPGQSNYYGRINPDITPTAELFVGGEGNDTVAVQEGEVTEVYEDHHDRLNIAYTPQQEAQLHHDEWAHQNPVANWYDTHINQPFNQWYDKHVPHWAQVVINDAQFAGTEGEGMGEGVGLGEGVGPGEGVGLGEGGVSLEGEPAAGPAEAPEEVSETDPASGKRKDPPLDIEGPDGKRTKPNESSEAAATTGVASNPSSETVRAHETPEEFSERTQPPNLYRAIRTQRQEKASSPSGTPGGIDAPPDGDLFPGEDWKTRRQGYRTMTDWPDDKPIRAADPTANEPVAMQVQGGNRATQYISTSTSLDTAIDSTVYNWSAAGRGSMRPPWTWDPVITVDATRLPEETGIYDVKGPHADELWQEGGDPFGRKQDVRQRGERDNEVLVTGQIPGDAVSNVMRPPQILDHLIERDPGFIDRFIQDFGDGKGGWRNQRTSDIVAQSQYKDQINAKLPEDEWAGLEDMTP